MLKRIAAALLAALAAVCLASCADQADESPASADVTEISVYEGGIIDGSGVFTEEDLTQSYDLSHAVVCELQSGKDITITKSGIYVISGEAEDSQIIVQAKTGDSVILVLAGAVIENEDRPCIYVVMGDKVILQTAEGSVNELTVTGDLSQDGTSNLDAAVFSEEDLTLNGHGKLTVNSTDNGIACKDDLKLTGGDLYVNAVSDALEAGDSVSVADGSITIVSDKDGLHSETSEREDTGSVYICGGDIDITADDDAVHAVTALEIDGGNISVNAGEGLEGTYVQINGGDIDIQAEDDAINAANKSSEYATVAEINGGTLKISMAQGDTDAIDSNGSLYINGGTVDITGQNAFDYTGEGKLNGGTVTVNGEEVTELTNQFAGMQGGMPEMAEDGERPEMPSDGEMPEPPSDGEKPERPSDGEMPEPPSDGERPERPSDGERPEMPTDGGMPGAPGNEEAAADTGTDSSMIIICVVIAAAAAIVAGIIAKSRRGWIKGKKE